MEIAIRNAHIVVGVLIFVVGFVFHWIGQLISLLHWDLAVKIGLQEKRLLPEYKIYEKGIASADVAIGWIYGVAAVGLICDAPWAYKLAWVPAVALIYHGLGFWFWTGNQINAGHRSYGRLLRWTWSAVNIIAGLLTILVVW